MEAEKLNAILKEALRKADVSGSLPSSGIPEYDKNVADFIKAKVIMSNF